MVDMAGSKVATVQRGDAMTQRFATPTRDLRLGSRLLLLAGLSFALLACGSGDGAELVTPSCSHEVVGVCVGVTTTSICQSDSCIEGVQCDQVITVGDDASLQSATAAAGKGACIALGPGKYGTANLGGGTHLLGKGSAHVTLDAISIQGGYGTVVRGVKVEAGAVKLIDAADTHMEQVLLAGSLTSAIALKGSASLSLRQSEIRGAANYGIEAFDTGDVDLDGVAIVDGSGPALWVACAAGCNCMMPSSVGLKDTVMSGNALAGMVLSGASGNLDNVAIVDTKPRNVVGGAAMTVNACSKLVAARLNISGASSYGLLIEGSTASLGNPLEEKGIIIVGTKVGMWVRDLVAGQGVKLENAVIRDNKGVGLGVSGSSKGIIIVGTQILNTGPESLLVDGAKHESVGDGLLWRDGALLHIDGLSLSGSARQAMLIDGSVEADSSIKALTLANGDELTGVLQQRVPEKGVSPSTDASVSIKTDTGLVHEVPIGPQAPGAL